MARCLVVMKETKKKKNNEMKREKKKKEKKEKEREREKLLAYSPVIPYKLYTHAERERLSRDLLSPLHLHHSKVFNPITLEETQQQRVSGS